jgi:hypothetical protein
MLNETEIKKHNNLVTNQSRDFDFFNKYEKESLLKTAADFEILNWS